MTATRPQNHRAAIDTATAEAQAEEEAIAAEAEAEAQAAAAAEAEALAAVQAEEEAAAKAAAEAEARALVEAEQSAATDESEQAELTEEAPTENDETFAARTEENIATAPEQTGADTPTVNENNVPRITALPSPPDAILPDDAVAPAALDDQGALPATRIAEATTGSASGSTDALQVVTGGMRYGEARQTLIDSGWVPRVPAERAGEMDAAETALIEAGYAELESCKGDERPVCRFEFVDGEKRIAAVLTAGAGTDPSVIDAFLMNIRAE